MFRWQNHRTKDVRWSLRKYKCLWAVGVRAEVQVSRREFHTHIYLDYSRVEFLSCIKKKKKKILDGKISYTSTFKNVGTKMIFSLLLYSKIHMDNREI